MFNNDVLAIAEEFKTKMHDVILDAGLKQSSIAHQGGVKQNTISTWLDPMSDRHVPAFEFMLLDERIVVPMCREFVKRFSKEIVSTDPSAKKNGSILDEVLEIGKIEGRLAEIIETMDKKKINTLCDALEDVVLRLRQECK